MGENDSSTLMLGAMCWLLGEEKAKKLARSVGRVSGEYKKTLKEIELGFTESKIAPPDMEKWATSLDIDTKDKSKKEIIASVQAKIMEGMKGHCDPADPFTSPEEYVSPLPSEESEEESPEEESEEESIKPS